MFSVWRTLLTSLSVECLVVEACLLQVLLQYHLFVMFTFEHQTEPVSGCSTLHESQCTVEFLSMDSQHAAVFWQDFKELCDVIMMSV